MNERFRNERNRRGQFGWQGQGPDERSGWDHGDERSGWSRGGEERSGWQQGREDPERGWQAQSARPQYSSDWDETYGSEWQRERGEGQGQRAGYDRGGGYGQRGSYGQVGSQRDRGGWYGQVSVGAVGGQGGGLGGGYTGGRVSGGYGMRDQGYRGRDIGSPGADQRGGFSGRGPKGYTRTDDRIREDVCDRLSMDDDVDASEIEVRVENGEVTLVGTVQTRSMKHQAEDIADAVSGVTDVHNQLRVSKSILNELKDKLTGEESERHYANSGTRDKPANGTLAGSARNGTL